MDNLIKLPVRRQGWWDEGRALTASRAFRGNARVIMQELIARTRSDGYVPATHRAVAQDAGLHVDTVQRQMVKLIADEVLLRTGAESPALYVWNWDRINVLAGQVIGRSGEQKRLSDANECSHLREWLACLEVAFNQVHFREDVRYAHDGSFAPLRIPARFQGEVERRIVAFFDRVIADAATDDVASLATHAAKKFHKSDRKKIVEGRHAWLYFLHELPDLEDEVIKAVKWERKQAERIAAKEKPAVETGAPPPPDPAMLAAIRAGHFTTAAAIAGGAR